MDRNFGASRADDEVLSKGYNGFLVCKSEGIGKYVRAVQAHVPVCCGPEFRSRKTRRITEISFLGNETTEISGNSSGKPSLGWHHGNIHGP